MYQLNYHSISRPGLVLKDLENILEDAKAVNATLNISGCLVYHNNRFIQILEGKKKDVLHVFGKIKGDERHHTVTLLWENHVEKRFFEEWNMAFYRPDHGNVKNFVNNLVLLSEFSEKTSGSLLSFWATVGEILRKGPIGQFAKV